MIIRSLTNVQELILIRHIYRVAVSVYIQFNHLDSALEALERCKDIAEDTADYSMLIDVYKTMGICN